LADDALATSKESGMFALSEPGKLDAVLAGAELSPYDDQEITCPIVFEDAGTAERAFMGAGPTQLAIGNSGEARVAEVISLALEPFTGSDGRVLLPAWYRSMLADA
jgi:hypothetical protein